MKAAKTLGIDLLQAQDRSGLVEGPLHLEHPLHQGRLRPGEDIAHAALILHGGAECVFDVAAVEGGDGLELVEGDGEALVARDGDPSRQREDLGGETCGVARGPDRREGHRDPPGRRAARAHRGSVDPHLGSDGFEQVLGPPPDPADGGLGGEERARVGFEEPDVRAGRGDGNLDGEDALASQAAEHVADQRRLAVAAGRDEEHLLALGQVLPQPGALLVAVGEGAGRDNLAVDERVVLRHYAIIGNRYGHYA